MAAPWSHGAQVRIIGNLHGQNTVNVLNFATNTVINDGDFGAILQQLADAIGDCIVDTLLPAVTSDWRFVRVEAYMIYPQRSNPIIVSGTPANVGQLSATSVSFASMLVIVRSLQGGRSGQGRWFLPPPGEDEMVNSLVNDATLVLLAVFLACVAGKFMGNAPSTDWRLGVLSRKQAGPTNAAFDAGFHPATGLNPKSEAAVLSSRRLGNGN